VTFASKNARGNRVPIGGNVDFKRQPQTTWCGRILTLHLNYVAGYTDPLLFLFELTQQLTPLTTKGKP